MDLAMVTFPCPSCNKTYLTQHSLTRHSHNHKKTSEHICPSCKVVFYRKDLLARHLKMHDPIQGGNQGGRRLRCHTACTNCRDARTKCDSRKPCASCTALGKQCKYSAKSARVSTNNFDKMSEDDEAAMPSYLQGGTTTREETSSTGVPSQPPFENISIDPSINDPNVLEASMTQISGMDCLDFANTSPGQVTAWPWLHEDLFLQQNWGGWTGFEPGFLGGSSLAPDEMTASLFGTSQDLGNTTVSHGERSMVALGATLAAGEDSRAKTMRTLHVPAAQGANQTNNDYDNARTDLSASFLPQQREGSGRVTNAQMAVISELIAYARQASLEPPSRGGHLTYWYSMSMRVREAFHMFSVEGPNASAIHCLDHLVHLYWDNFWALWPMISAYSFDTNSISPVLYLALSSIGAMYGGAKASHFGVLLHEALRELLCEPMLNSDESESSSLSMAQARLLMQVAALYFGQKRAFSYAQHLGSVLIAQTRRMDLFSQSRHQRELSHVPESTLESSENSKWLARWLLAESRKRLAFGILRAEVYTSVLLNARPMLCAEEVELGLPCSNYLWLTKFTSDSQFVAAIRQDANSNMAERLPFSDVVRITMECNEATIPLNVVSQELLIFGLQEHVWRLCHDSDKLARLTGSHIGSKDIYNGLDDSPYTHEESNPLHANPVRQNRSLSMISSGQSLESRLTGRSRQMSGLRSDYKNTAAALYNWRRLLSMHMVELTRSDRTSLMSGLLLFHISFLRIFAPIEKLHHISYRISATAGPEADILLTVWSWSQSDRAKIAVQHACIIWSLLFQECSLSEDTRAWFNFLALLGLHHASVVIWAFAGTHPGEASEGGSPVLTLGGAEDAENQLPVIAGMSRDLMTMFVRLYSYISPAWSVRSSFSAAAGRLANNEFPIQPD